MILSNKVKGIFVIIGGILMHIISGSVNIWSQLNVYLISYLRNWDDSLKLNAGFFLGPFGVFAISLSMSLGGYLERNFGPRQVACLGISLIIVGHIIIYFSHDLILDYFAMLISGMGVGCNYLIPVRLGYKYYPTKRGLIVGLVQLGLAFTATFLNIFAEMIINPDSENPSIVVDGDKFFRFEIAERIQKYLVVFLITAGCIGILTILFFFPYQKEEEPTSLPTVISNANSNSNNNNTNENPSTTNQNENQNLNINIDPTPIENPINTQPDAPLPQLESAALPVQVYPQQSVNEEKYPTVKASMSSSMFWILFAMAFSSNLFPPLVSNTFRVYGQNKGMSTKVLKSLASAFSGCNSFGRFIWGMIYDKVGFKVIIIPGNIILLIIAIAFYFTADIIALFGICIVITGIIMGSFYSIFPAFVSKIFGIKLSSEVYGLIFIGFGLANLIGPTFFYIIMKIIESKSFSPFLYAYILGGCFSLISCIIGFLMKEDRTKKITKTND